MNPGSDYVGIWDSAYKTLSGYDAFSAIASNFTPITNNQTGEVFWVYNGDDEDFYDFLIEADLDDENYFDYITYNYSTWSLGGN